MKNVQ